MKAGKLAVGSSHSVVFGDFGKSSCGAVVGVNARLQ